MKSIRPQELLAAISAIQEKNGISTGHRVKNIMSRIFRYAIASGLVEWDAAGQITGALIPRPEPQHYATVRTESEARETMQDLEQYDGNPIIRLGLLLLAYTFVRPSELRLAQWPELDFEKAEWRIPAERMKMRREHIVPLSSQALRLFLQLQELVRHPVYCFILPSQKNPISSNSFHVAMRLMGYGRGKMTPHGFRGMASTLLNENGFNRDVIERQLAHVESNAVRAAYNRAEYLDERRKMMQWWGDYLDKLLSI